MADKLRKVRINARLSQRELALALSFKTKSGQSYIARLEKGLIKNPTIRILLDYLRTCGESWSEFFKHLDAIDFRNRHEKMIAQLPIPPESRKVQRAAMRYETGIEFPSKEKPKRDIDFNRLKSRIETKVNPFLIKNNIEENQASLCQKFTREFFDFMAVLNKPAMKATIERYQRAGLGFNIIHGLRKIIINEIKAEIKRIEAKKPLPSKKQEKMAIGFTRYRIRIEKLEAEVHRLLCDLAVPTSWFASYKAFTRECYRVLKKYCGKNQELLNKNLTEIIQRWIKQGLKEAVLLKLKERIISVFISMRNKG